jgi:N-acetylmuramoyl-L-alanine amidase
MIFTVIQDYKNYSGRAGVPIDTIVLHCTATENAASAINWMRNPESKVSCHFIIDKKGNIYRLVPVEKCAWHAGKCRVPNANRRSIGVELVNKNDGLDPYTPEQLAACARLLQMLRDNYGIKYLVGHYEICKPAGRKTDPRGLNMDLLRERLGMSKL